VGRRGQGKIVDFLTEHAGRRRPLLRRRQRRPHRPHRRRKIRDPPAAGRHLPPGVLNIIGNGVVLDPEVLLKEIDEFLGRGIAISPRT
jgi:adenylosuccinate synthase